MKYTVVFERGASSFGAYAPDLPGVAVAAQTLEEAKRLIAEAIEFHIEELRAASKPIPEPTIVETQLVDVA